MHRTDRERTSGSARIEEQDREGYVMCIRVYTTVCTRIRVYIYPCGGYRGGCEVVGEPEAAHASFQANTWGSRGWGSTSSRRILRTMQVGDRASERRGTNQRARAALCRLTAYRPHLLYLAGPFHAASHSRKRCWFRFLRLYLKFLSLLLHV